jgi:hypothetical protein
MARQCTICSDSRRAKIVAEMVLSGAPDQAIADRIGGISRVGVLRHRQHHIVAPARALVEAAAKGRDAVEQRAQVLAAAEAGDPSAFIALAAIVADLRKVHERLERTPTPRSGTITDWPLRAYRPSSYGPRRCARGSAGLAPSRPGARMPARLPFSICRSTSPANSRS